MPPPLLLASTSPYRRSLLSRLGLLALPESADRRMMIVLHIRAMEELRATLGHELVERLLVQFSHRLSHTGFAEVARVAG